MDRFSHNDPSADAAEVENPIRVALVHGGERRSVSVTCLLDQRLIVYGPSLRN